jgi:hypothetical protein
MMTLFQPPGPHSWGTRMKYLGTPQTPALFCCTVTTCACRGALHMPRDTLGLPAGTNPCTLLGFLPMAAREQR